MEREFLAPHVPTVEERADPKLFASNVRKEMAAALGIQLCDLRWPRPLKCIGFHYISNSFEEIKSKYTKKEED